MGRAQFSLAAMARSWRSKLSETSTKTGGDNQRDDELEKFHGEQLTRATIPIETRLASGQKLWDQEFSSMSSCASHDLEIPSFDCCDRVNHPQQLLSGAWSLRIEEEIEKERREIEQESQDFEQEQGRSASRNLGKKWRHRRRIQSLSADLPRDLLGPACSSVPLVIDSRNPYLDFRVSIEEMVRENGILEWAELQELLYCYISLNSPEEHDSIKLAFVDVVRDFYLQDDMFFD